MTHAAIHCILPQWNVSDWGCLPNSVDISLNRPGDKPWWKESEFWREKMGKNMDQSPPATWLLAVCYCSEL